MKRWGLVLTVASLAAASLLGGCGAVSGAASVAGTAVSVAGTTVETAADIITAPMR